MPQLRWIAVYADGSELAQYNAEGEEEHQYADIDRSKLREFGLWTPGGRPVFIMVLKKGQRLIYRRRKRQSMSLSPTGSKLTGDWKTLHLVGWQETIHGTNAQAIAWVQDDNPFPVILRGRFEKMEPWTAPIPRPEVGEPEEITEEEPYGSDDQDTG